jgi:hypothetical protein
MENPTTPDRSLELAKLNKSGYRVKKMLERLDDLMNKMEDYFSEESPKGEARENLEKSIEATFSRLKNLLNSLDDFGFPGAEADKVLEILGLVEDLEQSFEQTRPPLRTTEVAAWRSSTEKFKGSYFDQADRIYCALREIPQEYESKLNFTAEHESDLAAALAAQDSAAVYALVLEIDQLLADNYAEYPKTIHTGTNLKFIVGEMIKRGEYSIALTGGGKDKPQLQIRKILRGMKSGSFEISFKGLDADQKFIWAKIR